ncbi:MAG: DNA mismatch repair protein MutS [Burkholderiales bacterium 28-67-8]|nr:MAG: DNA mismatch repair protein MutS [Burkholderiales bacterium 28-67-8]
MSDLQVVKKTLAERAAAAARLAAEARAAAAREQRERDLFALTVGPVQPLRCGATEPVMRSQAEPLPRQRELDEAAVLREAISDEFDVESLLETDDALSYRREGVGPEVVRKLRRGVWSIQAQLDLHGSRRDEAREQLGAFLRDSVRQGLRCVRVVHGKGNGSPGREPVLKSKVKTWLVQKDEVMAFAQARAADGGHGAVLVLLRSSEPQAASPRAVREPRAPRRIRPAPA